MASVTDLVAPGALEELTTPDVLAAGRALLRAGHVTFSAVGPLTVVAKVEADETAYHAELRGGSVLGFECSCPSGRAGNFCVHLAATALATRERTPARPRRAPAQPSAVTAPSQPGPPAPAAPAAPAAERPGPPLKVGVQLPEVEREVRWPELRDMARAAEAVGFDSIWLGDHLLYRRPGDRTRGPWEVWTTLAGLAEATERISLGPLVASTSFHQPPMLAKLAATVDEISGGRLILGLGAGWNETEYRAYGFPFDQRISRFEEAFTIIRTLLREGAIDFEGRYYSARDCELLPRGPRPGGPPLLVGSIGPRMLRATLPYVDAWNVWYVDTLNRPDGVPPLRDLVDGICREVDRDPRAVERTVAVLVRLKGAVGRYQSQPSPEPIAPLEGSPDAIAEGLRGYAREGIGHVQLVLDPITTKSIETLRPVLTTLRAEQPA